MGFCIIIYLYVVHNVNIEICSAQSIPHRVISGKEYFYIYNITIDRSNID